MNADIYLSDNYVALDFETSNKSKGDSRNADNHLVLSVYGRGGRLNEYEHNRKGEYKQRHLVDTVERCDFIIAHNAKFELGWLKRCGVDLTKVCVFDTMIAEYVIQGNQKAPLNLDAVAERYGLGNKISHISKLIKSGTCPSEMHPPFLLRYCKIDVGLCELLFKKQLEILKERNLLGVFLTRCNFTPVLTDIEHNGIFLDKDRVEKTREEYQARKLVLDKALNAMCEEPINWGSPNQLAKFIYTEMGFTELVDRKKQPKRNKPNKQFPDGLPKTDADTLDALVAKTKKQREFVELRKEQSKVSKALSTYLDLFQTACDDSNGVLQGSFNQCVTATHRLSSSKPNFQNFSREFKPLFTSRHEGWSIAEADYAQLEFRVAAFLGNDKKAIEDIENGFDVHSFTADIIGCARQEAKAHTFKPLFGGTSGTKDEVRYYKAFKEKYEDIARAQDEWVTIALMTKEQVIASGLKFYWPYIRLDPRTGYVAGNTNVRNYPIQSLATAEIVPIGVTRLWHLMKQHNMQSFIVNTVHDSVIVEIHPDERELFEELVVKSFVEYVYEYLLEVYDIDFNVKLAADIDITTHWGEKG